MNDRLKRILIVGGGIGGLTAAIALREKGFAVDLVERDPTWSVYGVGIIQQGNVVRAMSQLGLIEDYVHAGFGFEHIEIAIPTGQIVAKLPVPRLVENLPANLGISRRALQKVLADRTAAAGATVRLGITVEELHDEGGHVSVRFSDETAEQYQLVVGADGLYSQTRKMLFPEAPQPSFTGQAVWRYNLPRPADLLGLRAFEGPTGIGLVPLSADLMYVFVTTPEPGNPRYERKGLAAAMREKMAGVPAPLIQELRAQITDDDEVVYRPLEWLFLDGPWHKGRVVLLGDAVHASTPHLGQGAGMAIEDAIVLAEEVSRENDIQQALAQYHDRRFERCRYIVDASRAICLGQLGLGPMIENATASREMFARVAEPI